MNKAVDIVDFWFCEPEHPEYGKFRWMWFTQDASFDEQLRERFAEDYEQAAGGTYDEWRQMPYSGLGLILLLDQFPRNLFRNTPKSFATDPKALAVAESLVGRELDQVLIPVQRMFVYLPFEHSENLEHQQRSVELFERLAAEPGMEIPIDYARRHRDVIVRFGRFPHRNAILGRPSTPEEIVFLQQPGSSL
ncbi:DUF924 family protein [Gloeobacter morelensis]|uniref:DUF924 domain-containing protein n=1 Tax=Gloeobacter morelensis MG652769 TaxID=2781736 RepID=A0ABY3PUF7_9CYAN|nr:DUF924 domain-containing protein [Gloeobacter morelensis MG652769]